MGDIAKSRDEATPEFCLLLCIFLKTKNLENGNIITTGNTYRTHTTTTPEGVVPCLMLMISHWPCWSALAEYRDRQSNRPFPHICRSQHAWGNPSWDSCPSKRGVSCTGTLVGTYQIPATFKCILAGSYMIVEHLIAYFEKSSRCHWSMLK
jgi:hypothetical protein